MPEGTVIHERPAIEIIDNESDEGGVFAIGHYGAEEFVEAAEVRDFFGQNRTPLPSKVYWTWWRPLPPEKVRDGLDFEYENCLPESVGAIPVTVLDA